MPLGTFEFYLSCVYLQEERERERLRQRERRLREEERRKIIALNRERRIQQEEARKLKDEAIRLEREKTRIRLVSQNNEVMGRRQLSHIGNRILVDIEIQWSLQFKVMQQL